MSVATSSDIVGGIVVDGIAGTIPPQVVVTLRIGSTCHGKSIAVGISHHEAQFCCVEQLGVFKGHGVLEEPIRVIIQIVSVEIHYSTRGALEPHGQIFGI